MKCSFCESLGPVSVWANEGLVEYICFYCRQIQGEFESSVLDQE